MRTRPLALLLVTVACSVDRAGETAGESGSTSTAASSSSSSTSGAPPPTTGGPGTTGGSGTTGGPADTSSGTTEALDEFCHLYDQACPPGQKCTWTMEGPGPAWDSYGCVPARPDGGELDDPCRIAPGEPVFSGLDDCALGFICLNFDIATGEGGTCFELCTEDRACPNTNGGDAFCLGGGGRSPGGYCLARCDPLTQDCPAGQGCYGEVSLPGFVCFEADVGEQSGEDGSPCEFINACQPGLSCVESTHSEGCDPGVNGCCTPFCPVGGDEQQCAPSEDCVPFYADPPAGLEGVGVCTIPE